MREPMIVGRRTYVCDGVRHTTVILSESGRKGLTIRGEIPSPFTPAVPKKANTKMVLWYGMVVFFILARVMGTIWSERADAERRIAILQLVLDGAWFACLAALIKPA